MDRESRPSLPTVEELKQSALSDDLVVILEMAASDLAVIAALLGAGQVVKTYRAQIDVLDGAMDEVSLALVEAHVAAEMLLEKTAVATQLVLKDIKERLDRAERAPYN